MPERLTMEGPVDESAYLVGPGDVFSFIVGGRPPIDQQAAVTADGMLILAEVGSFAVSGRSLADVKSEIRIAMRRRYAHVATDVALAQPRQFYVHVSGAVDLPGRHEAVAVARVEDALRVAMASDGPLEVWRMRQREPRAAIPALRSIEIRHRSGDVTSVDLLRYYATGDTDHNPYLQDGDAIYVPSFSRSGRSVTVEDLNGRALYYDHRPGDTAADLFAIARGLQAIESDTGMRLIRPDESGALSSVPVHPSHHMGNGSPTLQPLDRLLATERNADRGVVTVDGFVVNPGAYPIVDGVTTLGNLLRQVGGLRHDALLRAAFLERGGTERLRADSNPDAFRETSQISGEARRLDLEREIYVETRAGELSFFERQFLTQDLQAMRRLSLNLEHLGDRIDDIVLRDGDRLVVPQDPGGVLVVGQVRQPGIVPMVFGSNPEAYIEAAGGRTSGATLTYVRDAASGEVRPLKGGTVASGDIVFVSLGAVAFSAQDQQLLIQQQQLDQQLERDRQERRFRIVNTTTTIVATTVSTLAILLSILR
ncbi:hypothetical protein BH23BAC4_BH23BAC4_02900 [soil metagenome]